jgi:hypothetical protein
LVLSAKCSTPRTLIPRHLQGLFVHVEKPLGRIRLRGGTEGGQSSKLLSKQGNLEIMEETKNEKRPRGTQRGVYIKKVSKES